MDRDALLPAPARVARGPWQRLVGLALSRRPRACALLIPRCRSVHTLGMRFALDLFWLGADGSIVRVDRGVRPWRIVACRGARAVIEVPSPPAARGVIQVQNGANPSGAGTPERDP